MRLERKETTVRVPGHAEVATRTTAEWVCPDCDYFEDSEEERT